MTMVLTQHINRILTMGRLLGASGSGAELAPLVAHERATRAVLVVDIVESVRLVEHAELSVISRWLGFVDFIKKQILPAQDGRLVKKTGDGLLIDFSDARRAISTALAIQRESIRLNVGLRPPEWIMLRMGLELCEILIDDGDIHGHGVNLAARLMGLANPGEIVASQSVRDNLTADLDAEVEDLGDCFLRHVSQPVRAYRIGPPGARAVIQPALSLQDWTPSIAVIPFDCRASDRGHQVVGEIFAEQLIRVLSQSPELSVVSRLSTTALRGRSEALRDIVSHLRADYVLSGSYRYDGETLVVEIELADAKSERVLWTDLVRGGLSDLLDQDQNLTNSIATKVIVVVSASELRRLRSQSLPTLGAYTLLMSAITLMHRLSKQDFDEAGRLLQILIDRATRQPIPHAWLANWHVLRVQQGWSVDESEDTYLALESTRRALDSDPDCSLALAVDGFVHTNLVKKLDVAQDRYKLALETNPSNALAWALQGALNAFTDKGSQAVNNTQRALKLTPLDPHRYFYDSLAASACIAACDYASALELARRSLRANRKHTSTLRVMSVAQWHLGLRKDARATAKELLRLEPTLTVTRWLKRTPSAPYRVGQEFARVLRKVGIPN